MELFYLGKPNIPPKEGYYIVRGVVTKPYFTTDFHIEKSYDSTGWDFQKILGKIAEDFNKSRRRKKNETDDQFADRIQKLHIQRFIYFHYKGQGWCYDQPFFDTKGFFVSNA